MSVRDRNSENTIIQSTNDLHFCGGMHLGHCALHSAVVFFPPPFYPSLMAKSTISPTEVRRGRQKTKVQKVLNVNTVGQHKAITWTHSYQGLDC